MSYSRVCVLMSTYNGEKYLRDQIDSILGQKKVDLYIAIRDDGSTDRTNEIIKEYLEKNENILFFKGKNLGVGESFLHLLSIAPDMDYYAFADQDDVWLEDKLITAINMIKRVEHKRSFADFYPGNGFPISGEMIERESEDIKINNDSFVVPVLYASNQILVDAGLNQIGNREVDITECDLYSSISSNKVYGCTMVFNQELKKHFLACGKPNDNVIKVKNHDAWMLYIAFVLGYVIYDKKGRILYRQHGGNVVGGLRPSFFDIIKRKYNHFTKQTNRGIFTLISRDLISKYGTLMSKDVKKRLSVLARANSLAGIKCICKDNALRRIFHQSNTVLMIKAFFQYL